MSAIEKLFPTSLQERSFQLKARRDADTAALNWEPPQFAECKNAGAVPRGRCGSKASTASFASLGDITLAEPGALIGFAGPHVIEQTIGEKLPEGFQRSEFQLQHGFVDKVVPRTEMKAVLAQILQLHTQGRKCR